MFESKTKQKKKNSTCIVCCFLPLDLKLIRLWNDFQEKLNVYNFDLLLISASDKPIDLNVHLIKVPFSMKNFQLDVRQEFQLENLSIKEKNELIDRDIKWTNDTTENIDLYQFGLNNFAKFYKILVEQINPTIVFLWGNTLPQMVIFQKILSDKRISNFVIERGFLTDTLMIESISIDPEKTATGEKHQETHEINFIYNKIKDYYRTYKLTKYEECHNKNLEEKILKKKENEETIIAFFGQSDIASGLIPRTNPMSTYLSPFFESTQDTFLNIIQCLKEIKNTLLVFKPHPHDYFDYSQYNNENIIIEKNIGYHTLLNISDVNIFGNTTLQFEALLYEKPIVLTANSRLYGTGIAYETKNKNNLKNQIELAIHSEDFNVKLRKSKNFINWFMSEYLYGYTDSIPSQYNLMHLADFVSKNASADQANNSLINSLISLENLLQNAKLSNHSNSQDISIYFTQEKYELAKSQEESNLLILLDELIDQKKYEEANLIIEKNINNKINLSLLNRAAKIEILKGNLLVANIILTNINSKKVHSEHIIDVEGMIISAREKLRNDKKWNSKISAQNLIEAEQNIEKNELDRAEQVLIEVLNIESLHFEALNNLAVVYILQENYRNAMDIILYLLSYDPGNEVALGNLEYIKQHSVSHTPTEIEVNTFSSYDDYKYYSLKMENLFKERVLNEKCLIVEDDTFTFPGYCKVCESDSNFLVDYLYAYLNNGTKIPNWRERVVCPKCGLNNRMRAAIHLLKTITKPKSDVRIYITEQTTQLYQYFIKNYPNTVGSECLGDRYKPGEISENGIRNEDFTNLTFMDNEFDLVLSFEVFEHIPDFINAFSEALRVLRPGGYLIFTVPFNTNSKLNLVRAVITNGIVEHIHPPEYHGDPVNSSEGCLCFYHFGWEVLEQLKTAGFENVTVMSFYSKEFGYLGGEQIFLVAGKPENVNSLCKKNEGLKQNNLITENV